MFRVGYQILLDWLEYEVCRRRCSQHSINRSHGHTWWNKQTTDQRKSPLTRVCSHKLPLFRGLVAKAVPLKGPVHEKSYYGRFVEAVPPKGPVHEKSYYGRFVEAVPLMGLVHEKSYYGRFVVAVPLAGPVRENCSSYGTCLWKLSFVQKLVRELSLRDPFVKKKKKNSLTGAGLRKLSLQNLFAKTVPLTWASLRKLHEIMSHLQRYVRKNFSSYTATLSKLSLLQGLVCKTVPLTIAKTVSFDCGHRFDRRERGKNKRKVLPWSRRSVITSSCSGGGAMLSLATQRSGVDKSK